MDILQVDIQNGGGHPHSLQHIQYCKRGVRCVAERDCPILWHYSRLYGHHAGDAGYAGGHLGNDGPWGAAGAVYAVHAHPHDHVGAEHHYFRSCLWPYAGNLYADQFGPYPRGDPLQPGSRADGPELPKIPVRRWFPRLAHSAVRWHLRRAGAGYLHQRRPHRGHLGCVGYTVLLCFMLFKTGSISKSIFGAH